MKKEGPWLFEGIIPREAKLGVLLEGASRRINVEMLTSDPLKQRVLVVRELNRLAGCNIKPLDFIALGEDYLQTESGKREAHMLEQYLKALEARIVS